MLLISRVIHSVGEAECESLLLLLFEILRVAQVTFGFARCEDGEENTDGEKESKSVRTITSHRGNVHLFQACVSVFFLLLHLSSVQVPVPLLWRCTYFLLSHETRGWEDGEKRVAAAAAAAATATATATASASARASAWREGERASGEAGKPVVSRSSGRTGQLCGSLSYQWRMRRLAKCLSISFSPCPWSINQKWSQVVLDQRDLRLATCDLRLATCNSQLAACEPEEGRGSRFACSWLVQIVAGECSRWSFPFPSLCFESCSCLFLFAGLSVAFSRCLSATSIDLQVHGARSHWCQTNVSARVQSMAVLPLLLPLFLLLQ